MLVEKIKKLLILTQQRAILEKKILGLTADTALCNKTEQELLKKNQSMLQKINLSKKKIALIELEIKTLSNRENDIKRNLLGLTKQKEIDSIKREVLSLQGSREDIEEDLMSEIDVLDDSEKALKTEQPLMLEQTNINNKKKVTIAAFAEETKLDLDPILQEINVEISSLPDSFKKRYNRIASRLDRPIVKVEGNFCGACYSFISSQQLAELKKMQIGDCKNCSRILFAAANVPEKVDD